MNATILRTIKYYTSPKVPRLRNKKKQNLYNLYAYLCGDR